MNLEQLITHDHPNLTGLIVRKRGEIVCENYFNGYAPGDSVHVASVTKSVFSALMGIAMDKGHIQDLGQKVLEFFPDYRVQPGETAIQRVTIRHMLTMTAPYKYASEPYVEFFGSDHWMHFALNLLGGDKQPGEFQYAGIVGTHILSGILARASGQSVFDFAMENLFGPLGIRVERSVVLHDEREHVAFFQGKTPSGWIADEQGVNPAGWGLTLTPLDMAKIGQMYLDGGRWDGRQVVPARWVGESTRAHSRWDELAYGYLWWILDESGRAYAAMGDGGNVIYVNTAKQLVVAIAATFAPNVMNRLALIREHIEPMFAD